jgi:2-polyprenyl-3-methyl-5-hydroxy-6-metoxy-1,4-benzoquinol methylase
MTQEIPCIVCSAGTRPVFAGLRRCPGCGLWSRAGGGGRLASRPQVPLSEERRIAALATLREANNERILRRLEAFVPLPGARVLDVGCAYGWFLRSAAVRGAVAVGIEPDLGVAAAARRGEAAVIAGYFPDCLRAQAQFDVIIFNDVFEHLADPAAILEACRERLAPGGRLVLNVPDSGGHLYRIACALARCGAPGVLDRLWQTGYKSPHLYYFSRGNLARLAARHGFAESAVFHLPQLTRRGLWQRLTMEEGCGLLKPLAVYAGMLLLYPLFSLLLGRESLVLILGHRTLRETGRGPI